MLAEESDLSRAVSEMQQSGWGPSEVEHLPAPNSTRKHCINEPLLVTDKEGIKNLTGKLEPLIKGTLARDFGLPFFVIKRMLLVP